MAMIPETIPETIPEMIPEMIPHSRMQRYAIVNPERPMILESMMLELPPKATLKLDHLNFRESSHTSAKNRADDLKTKIDALVKEEEDLKRELDDLREKYIYRVEVKDAERSQFRLKMLQQEGMGDGLQML